MRSAILCFLLCRCLAAQDAASIDGIVIETITRKPLPGVHINLRADELDAYGAISDKAGRFSVARIPPDVYLLSAERNGYLRMPGKDETADTEAQVTLSAGQHLSGLIVEMSARAAIAGKVIDESGDPVQGAHVEAVPADPRRPVQVFGIDSDTDERGEYRMTGLPGAYRIKVSDTGIMEVVRSEDRSDGVPAYAATWYPSATSAEQSRTLEAAAGSDVTGIDIRMVRSLSLTISGVVTGQGDHQAVVSMRLAGQDADPFFSSRKITTAGPDGKFRVSGLAPGRYLVSAFDNTNTLRSPQTEVSLQTADETGLALNLRKSEELSGSLKIEGASLGARPKDQMTVQLQPIGDAATPRGGDVDPDGAFRIEQVFPAGFRVSVVPLPENAYIKSVKLDGAESEGGNLDLTHGVGGARATIVVSLHGAQVDGTVTDADGKPFDNPRPFVALATKAEEIGGDTISRVEAGGKFRFTGVRPGKYRVVAIDPRHDTSDHGSLRKAFEAAAEFEVREGDRIERAVKITAAGTGDAER